MREFESYNSQFESHSNDVRTIGKSWVISPTNGHHEKVSVWWNEIRNKIAVISNVWPHEGLEEYDQGFCKEHYPWEPPSYLDGWHFIGEL
jgi:hypothetical protein